MRCTFGSYHLSPPQYKAKKAHQKCRDATQMHPLVLIHNSVTRIDARPADQTAMMQRAVKMNALRAPQETGLVLVALWLQVGAMQVRLPNTQTAQ